MKRVVFNEPDYSGGNKKIEMSIEDAVLAQKRSAEKSGFFYLYEKDALDDFLATNWAWIEETSTWEEK